MDTRFKVVVAIAGLEAVIIAGLFLMGGRFEVHDWSNKDPNILAVTLDKWTGETTMVAMPEKPVVSRYPRSGISPSFPDIPVREKEQVVIRVDGNDEGVWVIESIRSKRKEDIDRETSDVAGSKIKIVPVSVMRPIRTNFFRGKFER